MADAADEISRAMRRWNDEVAQADVTLENAKAQHAHDVRDATARCQRVLDANVQDGVRISVGIKGITAVDEWWREEGAS